MCNEVIFTIITIRHHAVKVEYQHVWPADVSRAADTSSRSS
jgi:hypothetical protein